MNSPTLPGKRSSAYRWRLWPAMALIVVPFLGLIGLQAYQALKQGPRTALSQQLVSHTIDVMLTAQSLRSALQNAERGQRGYLLTGQPAYLVPYNAAVHMAPPLLGRLTRLTADDPDQQRQIAGLAPVILAKFEELRRTIDVYRTAGFAAARSIVKTNAGLDTMQSIEVGIDKVIDTESRHRSRQLAALVAQERAADRIAMASALLVLVLMLSGLLLAVLSVRKSRRLQWEIQRRAEEAAQANRLLQKRNVELASASEIAREAKEEAGRAERAKGRFLATASHDLRQPLQAVSLLNGTLRRMVRDPDITEALRQQDEAISSMSKLLNALLDISKLEAGVIEPERRIIPVARVLAAMEQEFRGIARRKGLELQVAACEAYVHTDPALLEQIVRNLASNAIKYTRAGWVRLRALDDPPWVNIEVADSGIGIAPEQLPLIGEEFYQIGVPSNSSREGYGLGLSIVRRLVKLLAVELQVRSEVGKGSVFSVRIRQSAQAPALEGPQLAPPGIREQRDVNASILLVEDDPDVLNATRMLLRTEGYEVLAAASLSEAVQQLHASRGTDLLVTDFHLAAGETGVHVISRLREELGAPLKAVLFTGDTSAAVKDLAHDPNLRIVSKPVQAEAFLELVRALLAA
ncbi:MAG TPA: CHASE3 domain-containing protein [Steroidobacteraceae bacterium]|nr:CHASE3 domain-containing protein [Steroidobacteraceae bacterium]